MLRKRIGFILLVLVVLLAAAAPVLAQNLKFSVEREEVNLIVNDDGTVTITYLYTFVNSAGGSPIDYVDVGVPTTSYSLSSVQAQIDGQPVASIEESPYVKPGVAIGLGSRTIPPGGRGTLQVIIPNVQNMIYKTNKVQDVQVPYASFQFSPNSFGSEYVQGNTDVSVTLHLPTGLTTEEPRWFTPQNWPGDSQPASGFDPQGRVFYTWESTSADVATQYIFGAAFPQDKVPAAALVTEPIISKSTWDNLCPAAFCLGFVAFMVFIIWAGITGERKRKLQYLPPKISLEGNGIKRGLTAVEAAIVMEQPMDKILSMILFAVVKKGAAEVSSRDPLQIKALTLPAGVELRPYESDFIAAITTENARDKRKKLQDMMIALVKSVSEKMRGFSRKETLAYYQDIMEKAWEQVQAANTPEVRMQAFDDNMGWTMLDRNFDDRSRQVLGGGPVIVPMWWGRYDPGFGRAAGPAQSTVSLPTQVGQAPSVSNMPTLPGSDFAASLAGGIQSFSSNVVGDVTSFTSGVTNTTNPVPKTTSSSRSGGGGGGRSCACACACAGCACACAGGGR